MMWSVQWKLWHELNMIDDQPNSYNKTLSTEGTLEAYEYFYT